VLPIIGGDGNYYVEHFAGQREDTRFFDGSRLNKFLASGKIWSTGWKFECSQKESPYRWRLLDRSKPEDLAVITTAEGTLPHVMPPSPFALPGANAPSEAAPSADAPAAAPTTAAPAADSPAITATADCTCSVCGLPSLGWPSAQIARQWSTYWAPCTSLQSLPSAALPLPLLLPTPPPLPLGSGPHQTPG